MGNMVRKRGTKSFCITIITTNVHPMKSIYVIGVERTDDFKNNHTGLQNGDRHHVNNKTFTGIYGP
jgi:hypothetical protein